MTYKHTPGPLGANCLTCKRRHKKCDRGRPVCERCRRGGFECLGYGHNDQTAPGSSLVGSPSDPTWQVAPTRSISTLLYQSQPLRAPGDIHVATMDSWVVPSPFTLSSLEVCPICILENMAHLNFVCVILERNTL
ncbi:hypothetical protein BDV93DRAFT_363891 [Ceratobasidium sp. AG-I]|nr:hypothetical protein BDV93DRAFT_363891 [Ceratobasidium sp. AG-I]